ncbi:MAG: HAE1 family hydrophobic/amphiphilic exporter-1 [Flavobacteriales bacterium]
MVADVIIAALLYRISIPPDLFSASILSEGYNYNFAGEVEQTQETAMSFSAAVGLAVILIYLIQASLYESLIQPIIIMITIPLDYTVVITALGLSGNNFYYLS